MGCGKVFFTLVVTCSALLITYSIIISSNEPLKQDFPGPSDQSGSSSTRSSVIKMTTDLPSKSSNSKKSSKRLFHTAVTVTDSEQSSSSSMRSSVIKMPTDHPSKSSNSKKSSKRLFHTAVTATDSIYSTWQCRVMYYWFKKQKNMPNSDMGGFTRILHSGKSDKFMDEIPTFVAQPLPSGMDQGYVVLNRPWAFVQWLQQTNIEEDYILMSEPDHIMVKPIPNLSRAGRGAAFPFFYIEPKKYETTLRKFFPEENGPATKIDPIGNSPVVVGKDALKLIAPTWMNVSLAMQEDPEARKAFGWVLEMYAYAVASALHGVGNVLHKEFMIQPPWDKQIGKAYIIHYTYACDYNLQGNLTYGKLGEWRFDKRQYVNFWPPRNLSMPPPGVPESVVTLVKMVNEATANLPNWGS